MIARRGSLLDKDVKSLVLRACLNEKSWYGVGGVQWVQSNFRSPLMDKLALVLHYALTVESVVFSMPFLVLVHPQAGMFISLCAGLAELFNELLKWSTQVPRPFWVRHGVQNPLKIWEQDYSFPSSHAQDSSAIFVAILIQYVFEEDRYATMPPWLAVFLATLTSACGFMRIYDGLHTPLCVLTGFTLGCMTSILVYWLDILGWFSHLFYDKQLMVAMAFPLLTYATLYLVRCKFPYPEASVVRKWTELANRNTYSGQKAHNVILKPRKLGKYSPQIMAISASALFASLSAYELEFAVLRFLEEQCIWKLDFAVIISRWIIFLAGFALAGVMLAMASKFDKIPRKRFMLEAAAFSFIGAWSVYGAPKVAQKFFDLDCPIFRCPSASENIHALEEAESFQFDDGGLDCRHNFEPRSALFQGQLRDVQSLEELQNIIRLAARNGSKIRVVGAGHSFQKNSADHNGPNKLNNETITWISLKGQAFQQYKLVKHPDEENPLVIAGAGIFVGENEDYRVEWEDSLTEKLWKDGYSLASLPGIVSQQLGGMLLTGSDGGSSKFTVYDQIRGVRWVDGKGELRESWKNSTTSHALDEFNAVIVSLGLAGVVYEFILEPEPAYCVQYINSRTQNLWPGQRRHDFLKRLRESDYARMAMVIGPAREKRAFAILTELKRFDVGTSNSIHTCGGRYNQSSVFLHGAPYFTDREMLLMDLYSFFAFQPQCYKHYGGDNICKSSLVDKAREFARNHVDDREFVVNLEHCLKSLSRERRGVDQLNHGLGPSRGSVGGCLAMLIHRRELHMGTSWLTTDTMAPSAGKVGPAHRIIPIDQHGSRLSFGYTDLAELVFPLDMNDGLEVIHAFMDLMESRQWDSMHHAMGAEFYTGRASPFWMAPNYGQDTLRLGLLWSWFKELPEGQMTFSDWIEEVMDFYHEKKFTFRVHWGKVVFPSDSSERVKKVTKSVKEAITRLDEFRSFVRQSDPEEIFKIKYWDKRLFD